MLIPDTAPAALIQYEDRQGFEYHADNAQTPFPAGNPRRFLGRCNPSAT